MLMPLPTLNVDCGTMHIEAVVMREPAILSPPQRVIALFWPKHLFTHARVNDVDLAAREVLRVKKY